LEMACIAGNIAGEQRVRKIKDIVWVQPLIFLTGPQALQTSLKRIGDVVEYTISSADDENETIVHSEGRLDFSDDWTKPAEPRANTEDRIPIQALKAQCGRPRRAADFYRKFSDYGLQYGPSFQTLQEIYINGAFALSKLKMPDHLKGDFDQFILHPSMIDGALQTIAALAGGDDLTMPPPVSNMLCVCGICGLANAESHRRQEIQHPNLERKWKRVGRIEKPLREVDRQAADE
jgi:acyl transferase domain-containing protein